MAHWHFVVFVGCFDVGWSLCDETFQIKLKKSWFVCLLFACKTNVCSFFLFNGSSFHIRFILYYVYMAMFRFAVEIQNCSLFRWWCWWWWEYKTAKETKRMKGERKKKLANQINKKIHNQNIACSQII